MNKNNKKTVILVPAGSGFESSIYNKLRASFKDAVVTRATRRFRELAKLGFKQILLMRPVEANSCAQKGKACIILDSWNKFQGNKKIQFIYVNNMASIERAPNKLVA